MSADQAPKESWHLDKKVPIALILTLFTGYAGGIWFMSQLESRVVALEKEAVTQHERDERQDRMTSAAQDKLDRRLDNIDAKLDRLIERTPK